MAADVLEEGALVNDQRAGAGESLVLQSAEGNTGRTVSLCAWQPIRSVRRGLPSIVSREETNQV
jgi:hypothetical protein